MGLCSLSMAATDTSFQNSLTLGDKLKFPSPNNKIQNARMYKMPNFTFYGEGKQATTKFYISHCTWIWCLGIQLQEGSPTFDKVSG